MQHRPGATLWTDDAAQRFYLVPDDAEFAEGPLLLRAGASRRMEVDPVAVAPYEVRREEARAFLDARFEQYVDGVKQAFRGALDRFRTPPAPPRAAPDKDAEPGPGTRFFSSLTGVPEEELRDGPEAYSHGLRNLLGHEDEGVRRTERESRELEESAHRIHRLAGEVDHAAADAGARLQSLLQSLERLADEAAARRTPPAPRPDDTGKR